MNSEQQQSATIIRYFIEEAQEHLQTIERGVLSLQEVLADAEGINELFRAAHSIKGGAAMLSFDSVQHISHRLEDYFKILKDHTGIVVDEKLKSLLLASSDRLQGLLNYLEENFTISQELATETIAEAEPVFAELGAHLNALVKSMPGVDDTAFKEHLAENEAYDRLMVRFQEGVAEQLRDMLQVLRQDDNQATRQQLKEVCDRLQQLGESLTISGWRDLIATSKSAIANLNNPYLVLAQAIIPEIRQAQDLVLAEKSYEISVSERLQALVGDSTDSEIDVFAEDDLGLEDYAFTEDVAGNSDDFSDSFEGDLEGDFTGNLDAEDPFSFQEEEEVASLDVSSDLDFELLSTADELNAAMEDESSSDISFNWNDVSESSSSESIDEMFSDSADVTSDVTSDVTDNAADIGADDLGADLYDTGEYMDESALSETDDLSFAPAADASVAESDSDEYDLNLEEQFESEPDSNLETLELEETIDDLTDSSNGDFGASLSLADDVELSQTGDNWADLSISSLENEDDFEGEITNFGEEEAVETGSFDEQQVASQLDEELSSALALDEMVELEALGFDLDDADEEDNIIYQGLAASSQMLASVADTAADVGELYPAIAGEQVAEFFAEDDTSSQNSDTEAQATEYYDAVTPSIAVSPTSEDPTNEGSLELPNFSDTEVSDLVDLEDLENDIGLEDNDLGIDLEAPNAVDIFAPNLELSSDNGAEGEIQTDSVIASDDDIANMFALPDDIEADSVISLDFETASDPANDANTNETEQALETPEFGNFSDLLTIGENLGLAGTEVSPETTRLEDRTMIQEDDASVLDDLSDFDETANDEVDLENLFADDDAPEDALPQDIEYSEEIALELDLPDFAELSSTGDDIGETADNADDMASLSWLDASEEMPEVEPETARASDQVHDRDRVDPEDFGDLMALSSDESSQDLSFAANPQADTFQPVDTSSDLGSSDNYDNSTEDEDITESVFVEDAEDLLGDTAGRVSELYKKLHQEEIDELATESSILEANSISSQEAVRENLPEDAADISSIDFDPENLSTDDISSQFESASEQSWENIVSDDPSDYSILDLSMTSEANIDDLPDLTSDVDQAKAVENLLDDNLTQDADGEVQVFSSDAPTDSALELTPDVLESAENDLTKLLDNELTSSLEAEVNNSEFADLSSMLGDEEFPSGLESEAFESEFSDLSAILSDDESEISEIFGLADDEFPDLDLDNDDRDGGSPKLKDDRPDPASPNGDADPSGDDNGGNAETVGQDSSQEPVLDTREELNSMIGNTSGTLSSHANPVGNASNLSVATPQLTNTSNFEHSGSVDRADSFDELEVLLASSAPSMTAPTKVFQASQPANPLPHDSFDDLEALLSSPQPKLPTKPAVNVAQPLKNKRIATDEFDELESLLHDTYATKDSGSVNPKIAKRQTLAKRTVSKIVSQTMKVDVKHLDSLNNLVGELVVNRNLLAQDQEKLQQFIVNLLFKVQQLGDVAQRMRDQYDRSLLDSSVRSNVPSAFSSDAITVRQALDGGSSGNTITATFEDIEFDRYNSFHILSQEIIELVVRVRESASDIEFVVDETEQVSRQLGTITTQIQDDLKQVRMVPFAQIADRLPRAVRDLSFKTGKQAELEIHGRETLIDKAILEQLYDPMTHLVNNAIVHGLEDPNTRRAAGKDSSGKIAIRAFHQGNQTVISISDDGAGINTEKVKQSAVKKGLYAQSEVDELSDIQTYDLLFEAGFSTKTQADELAGRGVGLDVVRTTLNEIRGTVHTDSSIGKGTTFTIRLPLTLSISKAMFCISDRTRIAFPVDGFEDVIEIPQGQVQLNDKGQPCIPWRDTVLPFQPLSNLLSYNRYVSRSGIYSRQDDDVLSVIILRNEGNYLALQVDQFLGENEIVIKQLEGPIPKPAGIAGATILGDGNVMAIASVLELFDIASGRLRPNTSTIAIEPIEKDRDTLEPTVLIVDDSITVRELLSLTLSKVGYRVEQARDGQDAWEKLRSGLPCNLIICDIEMPRMDGLELLARLQKDEHLSQIPMAMLTSRGADRHRQTAKELGAKGYFTKPYQDEVLLSATQRMLQGEVLV
jgi:chemotaxis protein histidine kinase CheA/CheY-like chemotaxis protein